MNDLKIRINGRGNSWPVFLGQQHPFYNHQENIFELNSTSFSLYSASISDEEIPSFNYLIDAGHGIVQNLIHHFNYVPDAVFLTHAHIDHSIGIDWVANSYFKKYSSPLPVYTSLLAYRQLTGNFPQLKNLTLLRELVAGKAETIHNDEKKGHLQVISYPVYHGETAKGPSMLLFEYNNFKVLFTGDLLFPILSDDAINELQETDLIFADSNNRFPYPPSNHWSIDDKTSTRSERLKELSASLSAEKILKPHFDNHKQQYNSKYFENILESSEQLFSNITLTLFEFIQRIKAKKVELIHYSGYEDQRYNNSKILTDKELSEWCTKAVAKQILDIQICVPQINTVIAI